MVIYKIYERNEGTKTYYIAEDGSKFDVTREEIEEFLDLSDDETVQEVLAEVSVRDSKLKNELLSSLGMEDCHARRVMLSDIERRKKELESELELIEELFEQVRK